MDKRGRIMIAGSLGLLLSMSNAALSAADFLRGDANGDGRVSLADVAFLNGYFFFGRELPCEAAADFNDDEGVSLEDTFGIMKFAVMDGEPPAAPFPDIGPDSTASEDGYQTTCESYGGSPSLAEPTSRLRVLDAVALGGEDVHAVIRVAISNRRPVWSYSGVVRFGGDIVQNVQYDPKDRIGLQLLNEPFRDRRGDQALGRVDGGRLHFGLTTRLDDYQGVLPGDDVQVIALQVCLKDGTPTGQYSLTMESGEFSRARSVDTPEEDWDQFGRSVLPSLVDGTLTILSDVEENGTCRVRPLGERFGDLDASFELIGDIAPPGEVARVPLVIHADHECQGFGFDITYDAEVLEHLSIDKLYPPASDEPYRREELRIGEDGHLRGFVVFSFTNPSYVLPAHTDNEVLEFRFLVDPDTTADSTEVRFDSNNVFKAFGDTYTPELASSFVLINGLINIVGDVTTFFIRGDTNGDGEVNLSDVLATLGFLFAGTRQPHCFDAADANDDGGLDIADATATLQYLFEGGFALPPPTATPGEDSTPDDMTCWRRGRASRN